MFSNWHTSWLSIQPSAVFGSNCACTCRAFTLNAFNLPTSEVHTCSSMHNTAIRQKIKVKHMSRGILPRLIFQFALFQYGLQEPNVCCLRNVSHPFSHDSHWRLLASSLIRIPAANIFPSFFIFPTEPQDNAVLRETISMTAPVRSSPQHTHFYRYTGCLQLQDIPQKKMFSPVTRIGVCFVCGGRLLSAPYP